MLMDVEALRAENRALKARICELEQALQHVQNIKPPFSVSLDYFAVLHETSLAIMNRLSLDEALEVIVTHAALLAGTNDGFIDLLTPDGTALEMRIGIGAYAVHQGTLNIGEGISGQVFQTSVPMIVEDYRNWEGRIRWVDVSSIGTIVVVPLKLRTATIGVLGISYDESHRDVPASVVDLLTRFAELAAIAIDNARLYTTVQEELAEQRRIESELRESEQQLRHLYAVTRRQAQELHLIGQVREAIAREVELPALFRTVVETIAATFGYTLVSLYLRDGDELVLQHQVGYSCWVDRLPLGKGVMSRTLLSGKPVLIPDVRTDPDFIGTLDDIVSEVCVLLRKKDRIVGVLNVESNNGVVLTEDDLRLMVELAEDVNVAIERAWLYEQLRHYIKQIDALYDTMSDITGNLNRDVVLRAIVERMITLLRAKSGLIALYEPDQKHLRIHYSVGMDRDYAGICVGLGEGAIGAVAQTRQPLVVYDYERWEGRSPLFDSMPPSHVLAVPLIAGDELIGALSVGDPNLGRAFTNDDTRLLGMFAQQATIAIKNARLFADVQNLAITDPLTGMYNRRFFFTVAAREYEHARRYRRNLAVLLADIDNFKQINDRYGHIVGDHVLKAVSNLFRRELRSIDVLARYGGEEFVMLFPETDCSGVGQIVERLRTRLLLEAIVTEHGNIRITISFGAVVMTHTNAKDIETLIAYADQALLHAKRQGKDRLAMWCNTCQSANTCRYVSPESPTNDMTIVPLSEGPTA
ncbi:diguanylate cyclase [Roseiflexus sp.]|uniref:diguanylate cyclase n=1 Tax=Roseiflexus sp. TaxID=2562120 RepID=UPI00398B324D